MALFGMISWSAEDVRLWLDKTSSYLAFWTKSCNGICHSKVCYDAFRADKCKNYSISNKNSYSIIEVANMFKSKVIFLKPRLGERYASALTKISNNNKIIQKYGRLQLKEYISSFIKTCKLWKLKAH